MYMMNPTLLRSYFSIKSNDNFVNILGSILEELLSSVNSAGALVISQTNPMPLDTDYNKIFVVG